MYGYNQEHTYAQLFSATFSSLHNKIQWALLSSHILYCKKQNAGQCPGNEATFIQHVQIFACTIFSVCILSLFTFVKNASTEHWVWRRGKRKMTLKPLSLWESVLSLIITMAWTLFACILNDSSSTLTVSLTNTDSWTHLVKVFHLYVLGELIPCVHHTCTHLCIHL